MPQKCKNLLELYNSEKCVHSRFRRRRYSRERALKNFKFHSDPGNLISYSYHTEVEELHLSRNHVGAAGLASLATQLPRLASLQDTESGRGRAKLLIKKGDQLESERPESRRIAAVSPGMAAVISRHGLNCILVIFRKNSSKCSNNSATF